jgi:hypothetical protein
MGAIEEDLDDERNCWFFCSRRGRNRGASDGDPYAEPYMEEYLQQHEGNEYGDGERNISQRSSESDPDLWPLPADDDPLQSWEELEGDPALELTDDYERIRRAYQDEPSEPFWKRNRNR